MDGLFPAPEPTPEKPVVRLSEGRRLTLRQHQAVRLGAHPLAGARLHPEADPDRVATPDNATARPIRCGTCRWREQVSGGQNSYPKCMWKPAGHLGSPPRYSSGPATDVRSWWPGCADWQPQEVE